MIKDVNDSALSPVAGVGIMVAITVILAVVITALVFANPIPQKEGSIQFTILDIDDETHSILTITNETLFFRHLNSVSTVQFKHDFSMLQIGNRYSCEVHNQMGYEYKFVYNCTGVE